MVESEPIILCSTQASASLWALAILWPAKRHVASAGHAPSCNTMTAHRGLKIRRKTSYVHFASSCIVDGRLRDGRVVYMSCDDP